MIEIKVDNFKWVFYDPFREFPYINNVYKTRFGSFRKTVDKNTINAGENGLNPAWAVGHILDNYFIF